jgi:predicted NACHT family NTPase
MRHFASKWYKSEPGKHARFLKEFDKLEHKGLRELARTPLLMALLCLAFDETLSFPTRRVDLYKEALEALLKKWDVSRGIERDRDAIYRKLSSVRKEQMLARLAAEHFEAGRYFIKEDVLTRQITDYLRKLPAADATDEPDGEAPCSKRLRRNTACW